MSAGFSGLAYALDRIRRFVAPPVTIAPPPRDLRYEHTPERARTPRPGIEVVSCPPGVTAWSR